MKKVATLLLAMMLNDNAVAAWNGISHHSRANCINNESISWDHTHNWWFWVNSQHIDQNTGAIIHTMVSGWQLTWRNAQVHYGEGGGGWEVHGLHWMMGGDGTPIQVAEEYVTNCSIYDGWWD